VQLYTKILIGMVVGVVLGLLVGPRSALLPDPSIGQALIDGTEWVGRLFLAAIRMVVVPLVFCSLAVGVASLGDLRRLGRIGGRTLLLFLVTVVLAVTIGLVLANVLRPGDLMSDDDRARLLATYGGQAASAAVGAVAAPSLIDQVVGMVPVNPVAALAEGDMLQIIVFAVLLGAALTVLPVARSQPVLAVLEGVNDAVVVLVGLAMQLAPFGVAAILFQVVGTTGWSVLVALSAYGAIVLAGLFLHLFVVYAALVRFVARLPFFRFLKALRPVIFLAFGTSSSNATLPVTMRAVEEDLGVSRQVSSFVLPLGATVNMDGTALYQGVATVFVAQIYGMNLSVADQLTIVVMATLASVGAAGVPGAGMITLTMVLTAVGVPIEGLALVLGVDRLLDMFRTTVNVLGDCVASAVVATLEGEKLRVA
jgi:Na+/H+-dicarboxylate symporter